MAGESLNDLVAFVAVAREKINTSPTNYFPIRQLQLSA